MRTKYPEYFLVFFTKSLNRSLKRKIYFFYKEIKTATFFKCHNSYTILRCTRLLAAQEFDYPRQLLNQIKQLETRILQGLIIER